MERIFHLLHMFLLKIFNDFSFIHYVTNTQWQNNAPSFKDSHKKLFPQQITGKETHLQIMDTCSRKYHILTAMPSISTHIFHTELCNITARV
jgi:hypothetical protein